MTHIFYQNSSLFVTTEERPKPPMGLNSFSNEYSAWERNVNEPTIAAIKSRATPVGNVIAVVATADGRRTKTYAIGENRKDGYFETELTEDGTLYPIDCEVRFKDECETCKLTEREKNNGDCQQADCSYHDNPRKRVAILSPKEVKKDEETQLDLWKEAFRMYESSSVDQIEDTFIIQRR